MINLQTLRNYGFSVWVDHFRFHWVLDENGRPCIDLHHVTDIPSEHILPRGGLTTVIITDEFGNEYKGEAHCSEKDNYCRKTGVSIAFDRALLNYLITAPKINSQVSRHGNVMIGENVDAVFVDYGI